MGVPQHGWFTNGTFIKYGGWMVPLYVRRFPKMGVPQATTGFNTKMVIHDLDDLGYPYFRNPPY